MFGEILGKFKKKENSKSVFGDILGKPKPKPKPSNSNIFHQITGTSPKPKPSRPTPSSHSNIISSTMGRPTGHHHHHHHHISNNVTKQITGTTPKPKVAKAPKVENLPKPKTKKPVKLKKEETFVDTNSYLLPVPKPTDTMEATSSFFTNKQTELEAKSDRTNPASYKQMLYGAEQLGLGVAEPVVGLGSLLYEIMKHPITTPAKVALGVNYAIKNPRKVGANFGEELQRNPARVMGNFVGQALIGYGMAKGIGKLRKPVKSYSAPKAKMIYRKDLGMYEVVAEVKTKVGKKIIPSKYRAFVKISKNGKVAVSGGKLSVGLRRHLTKLFNQRGISFKVGKNGKLTAYRSVSKIKSAGTKIGSKTIKTPKKSYLTKSNTFSSQFRKNLFADISKTKVYKELKFKAFGRKVFMAANKKITPKQFLKIKAKLKRLGYDVKLTSNKQFNKLNKGNYRLVQIDKSLGLTKVIKEKKPIKITANAARKISKSKKPTKITKPKLKPYQKNAAKFYIQEKARLDKLRELVSSKKPITKSAAKQLPKTPKSRGYKVVRVKVGKNKYAYLVQKTKQISKLPKTHQETITSIVRSQQDFVKALLKQRQISAQKVLSLARQGVISLSLARALIRQGQKQKQGQGQKQKQGQGQKQKQGQGQGNNKGHKYIYIQSIGTKPKTKRKTKPIVINSGGNNHPPPPPIIPPPSIVLSSPLLVAWVKKQKKKKRKIRLPKKALKYVPSLRSVLFYYKGKRISAKKANQLAKRGFTGLEILPLTRR